MDFLALDQEQYGKYLGVHVKQIEQLANTEYKKLASFQKNKKKKEEKKKT